MNGNRAAMKSERQENLLKISQNIDWHIMSYSSVNSMFSVESIAQVSSLSMLLASNAGCGHASPVENGNAKVLENLVAIQLTSLSSPN